MNICEYGCGQKALFKLGNGKWCCSKSCNSCISMRIKNRNSQLGEKNHRYGKKNSKEIRKKISIKIKGKNNPFYGKTHSDESKRKIRNTLKFTIKQIKNKYPTFSKIEEMRYNPDKLEEKEIQVRCKNHNCPNSKEQDGWFTPTYYSFKERIRQIEHPLGSDACYYYCSDECKDECPLYNKKISELLNPNKENKLNYTNEEYQTFRNEVLKRSNCKCEYCGKQAIHVHHSRPQKLEPFYSLDPDFGIACCGDCHFKYGHKDECSTGQLANKVCKDA